MNNARGSRDVINQINQMFTIWLSISKEAMDEITEGINSTEIHISFNSLEVEHKLSVGTLRAQQHPN